MERNSAIPADRGSGPGRRLARVAKVEPKEFQPVVLGFLLFFCVLGGYFMVRPVRETVGTVLGTERVANLYIVTWVASVAIVPLYGALCARFRRSTFLPWIYGFVAVSLAGLALAFRASDQNIAAGQFFYVFISVLNLFVVSVFWSFLLELFSAGQVKRLFGVIAAGGTAGALIGPVMTDIFVGKLGHSGILFLGAGMFTVAIVVQRALLRYWSRHKAEMVGAPAQDRPIGGNPFAGFTLVLKSPYLLGIATFVVLLAAVNTFLYFAQLRIVSETFADTAQRTRVFSRLDYTVQSLTIICQLFFTGRIAARFGIGSLLTAVPITMFAGFLLLAGFHTFSILALVMIARRVGEYAFIRPGREMLFSRVDTESKYKAKNLIDVPVYRGGDAITAQISAGGLAPTAVALLGAGVAAVWAVNGYLLGRSQSRSETPAAPMITDQRPEPART